MPELKPLMALLEQAERERDEAQQRHHQARAQANAAQDQAEQLLAYRRDCEQRWGARSGAAGEIGQRIFGIVMWCAAITSVIGAAYTSISFLKTFGTWSERRTRLAIVVFIAFSTTVFPKSVLCLASNLDSSSAISS